MIRFSIFIFFLFLTHYSTAQYIENKGQWPENVLFGFSEDNIQYFIEHDGITVCVTNPLDINYNSSHSIVQEVKDVRKHAFQIGWTASSFDGVVNEEVQLTSYSNFIGSTEQSAAFCRHLLSFTFFNVWPGVDIHFSTQNGRLKYDYIVNTSLEQLNIEVVGEEELVIRNGQIFYETTCGAVAESYPHVYCKNHPEQFEKFALEKTTNGYRIVLPETNLPLVVDPLLEGASYVGAAGSATGGGAIGFGSNYFDDGSLLGYSGYNGLGSYPVTLGSFVEPPMSSIGIGITKFSEDLNTLEWSTIIFGTSYSWPLASFISNAELVLVMANNQYTAYSGGLSGFQPLPPLVPNTSVTGFDESYLHLTVISEDGSQLLRSRLIGSVSMDMFNQIANVGMSGFVADIDQTSDGDYVVVCTVKDENFPVTEGAFDNVNVGTVPEINQRDAALFRISQDLQTLKWATFWGGNDRDYGFDVEVDQSDNIYIGGTSFTSSIVTTPGAWLESSDLWGFRFRGFISKFTPEGNLIASTAYGFESDFETILPFSSTNEVIRFLEIDNDGNIWGYGYAPGNGSDIEITPGAYNVPNGSGFICKFNPDLSELLLSTRVGFDYGLKYDPTAFMIDNCGYIYTSACTATTGLLENAELTDDAISTQGGFYLTVYEPEMAGLHHASIFGGDHIDGGKSVFDKKGVVYQTVCVPPYETYFEATPGAWSTTQGVNYELAAFKIDFQSQAATAIFSALLEGGNDCPPYTLNLENYSTAGEYTWFLNGEPVEPEDGSLELAADVTGDIQIGLSVFNPESCNITDTVYKIVHLPQVVLPQAAWDLQEPDLCNESQALLEATFTGSGESFEWSFDGVTFSDTLFSASIAEAGEYSLQLVASESQCNLSDTLQYTFEYAPLVFETTSLLGDSCLVPTPFTASFLGTGAAQLEWMFDGGSAGSNAGIDLDLGPGNHQISLTANSALCGSQSEVWDLFVPGSVNVSLATPADITLCLGETTTLTATTSQGTPAWEINGNQLAGSSLTITPQQSTTALFIATDLESCNIADTAAVSISVVPPPAATFEFEKIDFPCEQQAEVVVGFTGSATTLLWDFGDGSTSSFADENHGYLTGDYQLTLTAFAPPCAPAESAIDIEVAAYSTGSGDIFPVNIITPNGDGINDCLYWETMQYDNITDFSISIFNRWGVLVYTSENGAFRWCPTDIEDGVYYYVMKWYDACEEREGVLSGEVTVGK